MSPTSVANSVRDLGRASLWSAVILGLGVVIMWPVVLDWGWDLYDSVRPIAVAKVLRVEKRDDEAMLSMTVEKRRDCERLGIYAYSYHKDGVTKRINIQRPDIAELGYVPAGTTILAEWRIWPTTGAHRVSIHMTHQCAGRVVVTHMATVDL